LLATGEDPTELIFDFAVKKDILPEYIRKIHSFISNLEMNKRVHTISLGQHQGPSAERQIAIALERGNWVLLQNCHLAVHWLVALEVIS
jgi:dynein heavy chain